MNQKDIPVDVKAAPLPAEKLLQAVREAVGVLDEPEPARVKAKGKAGAKSSSKAGGKTAAGGIEARASERLMRRELRRQENLEKITRKALAALPALVARDAVDPDWIGRFFGYCHDVGHDELQSLWAKLLAGEVTKPGTHSLRTLRIVRDMARGDVQLFAAFCRFVWVIPGAGLMPVVHDLTNACFTEAGLTQESLAHLASLGLITFNEAGSFNLQQVSAAQAFYYGRAHTVSIVAGKKDLHIGRALLTDAGKALAPITGSAALESYRTAVVAQWRSQAWTVAE